MKKMLLLIMLCFCSSLGWAQFTKGDQFIGGIIGYSKTTSNNFESSDISVSLDYMTVKKENLLLGIVFGYNQQESSRPGSFSTRLDNELKLVSGSVYVRRPFPVSDRLALFLQGELIYGRGTVLKQGTQGTSGSRESQLTIYGLTTRGGLMFSLSDRMILETTIGSIGYNVSIDDDPLIQKTETKTFGLNIDGSELRLAFRYRINRENS